jgi:hypothetical protein
MPVAAPAIFTESPFARRELQELPYSDLLAVDLSRSTSGTVLTERRDDTAGEPDRI